MEAINFLQAIEIISGKAFRLFSEHRKSSIIIIKFVFIERKKKGIGYDVYSYPHKKTRGSIIVNRQNLVKAHKKSKKQYLTYIFIENIRFIFHFISNSNVFCYF